MFTFEQIETYLADEHNEQQFLHHQHEYQKLLKEEIASHKLFDHHYPLRLTALISGVLLIPYTIFLGIHELIFWMICGFALIVAFSSFAILYKPKTAEGLHIKKTWQTFKTRYEAIDERGFQKLADTEKERALIFTSGFNDEKLTAKNKLFAEQLTMNQSDTQNTALLLMLLTLATTGHRSFQSSTEHVQAYDGGSSGGGTAVGGGGGGSGAF